MSESVFPYKEIDEMKKDAPTEDAYLDNIEYQISSSLEELSKYAEYEDEREEFRDLAIGLTALTEIVINIKKSLERQEDWRGDIE